MVLKDGSNIAMSNTENTANDDWTASSTNPALMAVTNMDTPPSTTNDPKAGKDDAKVLEDKMPELSISDEVKDRPPLPPRTPSSSSVQFGAFESAPVQSSDAPAPPPKDWLQAAVTPSELQNGTSKSGSFAPLAPQVSISSRLQPPSFLPSRHAHNRSLSGSSILDGYEENTTDEKAEIQSIMDQFSPSIPPENGDPNEKLAMVVEKSPPGATVQPPPRGSSLENLVVATQHHRAQSMDKSLDKMSLPPTPTRSIRKEKEPLPQTPITPPQPDPEPPLAFDFHRFLEQLRHRTADPVAKFLRSFLAEFSKKQWQVHEQVKIISDFLEFIHVKMGQCEVWRDVSDDEFDNAKEGMEKLVMNRLYTQTFSPCIPAPQVASRRSRVRQREKETILVPGRSGQHLEDTEKDDVLSQKAAIYGWVKEEHLDIQPVSESGRKFLSLAQQELLKIKNYRAPRDKVICVLNCCKVIFGLLRHSNSAQSADDFIPLLIYVVLRANPDHLVSNIQYITRFRNPEKLGGEAGYYLSSLGGAVQFIETLDRKSLTCEDAEFEKNVEEAVRKIAETKEPISPVVQGEKSTHSRSASAAPGPAARKPQEERKSQDDQARKSTGSRTSSEHPAIAPPINGDEEKGAISGLLKTIGKPLSTIGRILSDDGGAAAAAQGQSQNHNQSLHTGPALTPLPGNSPRTSPGLNHETSQQDEPQLEMEHSAAAAAYPEESAARQASAETAEALNIQRAEHENTVSVLAGMFPDLDKEVIDDVVRQKDGRVGLAVDACLALSAT